VEILSGRVTCCGREGEKCRLRRLKNSGIFKKFFEEKVGSYGAAERKKRGADLELSRWKRSRDQPMGVGKEILLDGDSRGQGEMRRGGERALENLILLRSRKWRAAKRRRLMRYREEDGGIKRFRRAERSGRVKSFGGGDPIQRKSEEGGDRRRKRRLRGDTIYHLPLELARRSRYKQAKTIKGGLRSKLNEGRRRNGEGMVFSCGETRK